MCKLVRAIGVTVLQTVAKMARPLLEKQPIGATRRGKLAPMGATLFFAIPLTEDNSVDRKLKEWNKNEANHEASYLFQTAVRMVSWVGRSQQLKFSPKTLHR